MKKKKSRSAYLAGVSLLVLFILWTVLVRFVDVQAIGPEGSRVGFATLNGAIHRLIGVHMPLYVITDWLSLVPIFLVMGFALLGLLQWIRRGHLWNVDADILLLGGFYILVMALYLLFEVVVINERPVLIEGVLETSYPSSTTMLVMCVMPTAVMEWRARIKKDALRRWGSAVMIVFGGFMVIGRLASGVHWFTDIIGGALLSVGLVLTFRAILTRRLKQRSGE